MLLNTKALVALGYSKWMLRAIKLAAVISSDNPFVAGHHAYEDDIRKWLKRHPEFVPNRIVTSKPPRTRIDLPAGAECRSDVRAETSAPRTT